MLDLFRKLARDTVGSSISTEMSLVTAVTVGALVMGMGNFSATVNRRFETVSKSEALNMKKLEREEEDRQKAKRAEFEARRAEAIRRKEAQNKK